MPWYGYALLIGIPVLIAGGVVLYFVLRKKPEVPKPKDSWEAGHDAVGKVVEAGEVREEDRAKAEEEHRKEIKDGADAVAEEKKTVGAGDEDDVASWIDNQ